MTSLPPATASNTKNWQMPTQVTIFARAGQEGIPLFLSGMMIIGRRMFVFIFIFFMYFMFYWHSA
jgi:hypothetical protein